MEIIRVKRKITSSLIRIPVLMEYIGKQVEISISEHKVGKRSRISRTAGGFLENFRNPILKYKEKEAWQIAVNEKHGNS